MRGLSLGLAAAATIVSTVSAATTLDPIVIKGSKFFFKSNGTQFFMRGVAYQADLTNPNATEAGVQQFVDPLADPAGCARDVPLMAALKTNTIRVYAIDTAKDHSQCMQLLANAGIYVVADLSEPGLSINRDSPAWDLALYQRYTSVVDAMANYTNVLGFFAGNEVTNNATNTDASPFVKAAIRDMKSYIKTKNYRSIPVGYATNDDSDIRGPLADYFDCGDTSASADFWGYNIYSWCDPSSYTLSGWDQRTLEYSTYNIPSFFAEYGCNTNGVRTWGEVASLYGPNMTGVFSGGIVYMYFQETNKYGLVDINNGKATKLQDYINLQTAMASVNPTGVQSGSYTPTNTPRACPASNAAFSASTILPPTPDQTLCDCMVKSLSCVAKSSVSEKQYGDIFGFICGAVDGNCAGISGNGTTGQYGAFSVCQPKDRLSWAMNAYYQQFQSTQGSGACDFESRAQTQTASTPGNCQKEVDNAGGIAGTATASPGSTSTGKNAAGQLSVPSVSVAAISMVSVIITAFLGGVGMIVF